MQRKWEGLGGIRLSGDWACMGMDSKVSGNWHLVMDSKWELALSAAHTHCSAPRGCVKALRRCSADWVGMVQHATCNVQHTTYNMQLTTYNIQHTTYNMQHTTYNMQLTTVHQMQSW